MTTEIKQPNKYLKDKLPNYNKTPYINVPNASGAFAGWNAIVSEISNRIASVQKNVVVVAIDYYPGIDEKEIFESLIKPLNVSTLIHTADQFKSENEIRELTQADVTDDEVFGYITRLNLREFFDEGKLRQAMEQLKQATGVTLVYGYGACLIAAEPDILIYADMPRWELQLRYRRNEISNLGLQNKEEKASLQYKRGFFVDWRVADKHKKSLIEAWDYVLDTTISNDPKLVNGESYRFALQKAVSQPFRVVPFFDPGPWGGQWMKEVCDLDREIHNFAWCFDCVPEENSLLLKFDDVIFETPAINLVFYKAKELLGNPVQARFGDEFPIRFDFLDTMEGGNLSLQVHPTTEYARENFGINYTQDESYYILDAGDNACVYLGFQDSIDPKEFVGELKTAHGSSVPFNVEKHVLKWPVKKHDHFLIPAGTIHCSGAESMVLEISATPYIFTFKLWDWERLGLDGKPRPINIEHGKQVLDWSRTKNWTKKNLINTITTIAEGNGWKEERTGLHEREFIETRRHWFSEPVTHLTNGSVNVLNLIEGCAAVIESPDQSFEPYVIHYAETVIIPEAVKKYTVRPFAESEGAIIGTIKAFVRN